MVKFSRIGQAAKSNIKSISLGKTMRLNRRVLSEGR
jgi:hypothetical protein